MKYTESLSFVNTHFNNTRITERHLPLFKENFSKDNVKELLLDIADNKQSLDSIASKSYLHALGFYKIVLIDSVKDLHLPKSSKVQLRFHVWEPNSDSVPIVESLHEHSFDFISTVLCGELENQSFKKQELNKTEQKVLNTVLHNIRELDKNTLQDIDNQIEYMLCKKLAQYGSNQFNDMNYKTLLNPISVFQKLHLGLDDIDSIIELQGFYKSDRVSGEKKSYKHILDRYIALKIDNINTIKKGEFYYHNYQYPHRLFYNAKELNATLLLTTNVPENAEGGSFQRPTYVQNDEINYEKRSISSDELKKLILMTVANI